ncbi:MAG: hypothetical protein CMF19_03920 [Idiomarinaceae bacterium]|nr:hypothetical protein [Idiomarinaceae bacterium]
MPEPAISPANGQEPADYFNTVAYSGNNTQLSVTGVGFEPNWTWIKKRNGAASHALQDSVRGSFRYLVSNSTAAENTNSGNDWFRSFDSDGFTVSKTTTGGTATTEWNNSGDTYVSWNWLAGGTAVSNTDGSITSSVSANTKAGFSVVSYTGDGTASTIGHGLDSAPEMYIIKDRESTDNWVVYHKDLTSASYYLTLDTTNAQASNNVVFNGTDPTSSVFSVGTSRSTNGNDFIAYCFHSVPGYSLVSSYSGNSSSDGVFVHCGFKPAFVIIKVASVANRWVMFDNKRSDENPVEEAQELNPNDSTAESSSGTDCLDFLSNGFKLRRTGDVFNTSGYNYIFIAFAEQPFKYAQAR